MTPTPTPSTNCLTEWELDLLSAGMPLTSETRALQLRVEHCPHCQELLSRRMEELAWLEETPNFKQLARQSLAPPTAEGTALGHWWERLLDGKQGWWLATAFASTVFVFWLSPQFLSTLGVFPPRQRAIPPGTSPVPHRQRAIAKSSFSASMLSIVPGQKRSRRSVLGRPTVLVPQSMIQFELRLFRASHVLVVGVNEKAEVFAFVPLSGTQSMRLPEGSHMLPKDGSLELDEYIGWERVFVLVSDAPIALSDVKRSVHEVMKEKGRDLRAIEAFGKWRMRSFLIKKTRR